MAFPKIFRKVVKCKLQAGYKWWITLETSLYANASDPLNRVPACGWFPMNSAETDEANYRDINVNIHKTLSAAQRLCEGV